MFDDDGTGKISIKNLKRVARELGETMTEAELHEMIDRADGDRDGEISPEEFYAIMVSFLILFIYICNIWYIFLFILN